MMSAERSAHQWAVVMRIRFAEDYAHYARGEATAVHSSVGDITGIEPCDLRTFARDYAHSFPK
jgi:hypothetical protein